MTFLDQKLRQFARLLGWFAGLGVVVMMAHVTADVLLRSTGVYQMGGVVEMVGHYYMVIIVFLPLALMELDNKTVTVDVLYERFGPQMRLACNILGLVASITFYAVFTYQTAIDAIRAFSVGSFSMGEAQLLIWPSKAVLPLGLALAAVSLTVLGLRNWRKMNADL